MKTFKAFFMAALMLFGSVATCFASVANEDVAIGDLSLDKSFYEVKEILGKPDDSSYLMFNKGLVHKHSSVISYYSWDGGNINIDEQSVDGSRAKLTYIIVSGDEKIKTPAGIHVGSTQKDVETAYGTPDMVDKGGMTMYYYHAPNGNELAIGIVDKIVVNISLTTPEHRSEEAL